MTKSFNELAGELKTFIIDEHSNYKGLKNVSVQRYNNLKIGMNAAMHATPHIIVRIGMSEAVYTLPNGTRLTGGLGMDERYVIKWFGKSGVIEELESHWKVAQLNSAST